MVQYLKNTACNCVFTVVLVTAFSYSVFSYAEVTMNAGIGSVAGSFKKGSSQSSMGYLYSGSFYWHSDLNRTALGGGLGIYQYKLQYDENEVSKNATYNLMGINGRIIIPFGRGAFQIHLTGEYFPISNLTVSSKNSYKVNDDVYKYSIIETYNGKSPVGGSLSFISNVESKQFNRHERMTVGLIIGGVSQKIDSESFKISTSNSNLDPGKSKDLESLGYSLVLINVSFIVGFTF